MVEVEKDGSILDKGGSKDQRDQRNQKEIIIGIGGQNERLCGGSRRRMVLLSSKMQTWMGWGILSLSRLERSVGVSRRIAMFGTCLFFFLSR